MLRLNVHTMVPSWLKPRVTMVTIPCPGRDLLSRFPSTSLSRVERIARKDRSRELHLVHAEICNRFL